MDNMEWTPLVDGESEITVEPINKMGEYVNLLNTGKVDKVTGKGLSTNDFTTDLLNKLNGIDIKSNVIYSGGYLNIDDYKDFSGKGVYIIKNDADTTYQYGMLISSLGDSDERVLIDPYGRMWTNYGYGDEATEWQEVYTTKEYVDSKIGDVETALDNIIALQNSLIGGDA